MIKHWYRTVVFGLLTACTIGNVIAESLIKSFTQGSHTEIVKQYQGKPFVIALWSLDCPSCYKELTMLAEERQKRNINLVLISVDGAEAKNEVEAVLKKYALQTVDAWLFEEHSLQTLRYEIDPLWYGEVPRSYIFDKGHQRTAVSGVLTPDQLPN